MFINLWKLTNFQFSFEIMFSKLDPLASSGKMPGDGDRVQSHST
jgi:hypothetical protein